MPLEWYHSVTYAFFPDETHRSIRRTFPSAEGPAAQRQFCGFCGTQLSAWNESTAEDARHINITLGSLVDDDVDALEAWGLLTAEDEEDEEADEGQEAVPEAKTVAAVSSARQQLSQRPVRGMAYRGTPWFEEMVEDSQLGRIRRQRGGYESQDGRSKVQWEVVELASDGTEVTQDETLSGGNGKRKRGNSDDRAGGDVQMRG